MSGTGPSRNPAGGGWHPRALVTEHAPRRRDRPAWGRPAGSADARCRPGRTASNGRRWTSLHPGPGAPRSRRRPQPAAVGQRPRGARRRLRAGIHAPAGKHTVCSASTPASPRMALATAGRARNSATTASWPPWTASSSALWSRRSRWRGSAPRASSCCAMSARAGSVRPIPSFITRAAVVQVSGVRPDTLSRKPTRARGGKRRRTCRRSPPAMDV
jgi:hypothetical protein